QLRNHAQNIARVQPVHGLDAERPLQVISSAQVVEMLWAGGDEHITLRPISSRMPHYLLEGSKELDRVHGEPDVQLARKLGADAAHAFPGKPLPRCASRSRIATRGRANLIRW